MKKMSWEKSIVNTKHIKFEFILHETTDEGQIHIITINRPKKLNALSFEAMGEIAKCIQEEINPFSSGARVVILKANGKHFTAGLDLNSAAQISEGGKADEEGEQDVARKAMVISDVLAP